MPRRECNHEFLAATCDGKFGDSEPANGLLNPRLWGDSPFVRERGTVRVHSDELRGPGPTPHLDPLPLCKGRGEKAVRPSRAFAFEQLVGTDMPRRFAKDFF